MFWKRKTKQEAEFTFYSIDLIGVYSKDSGTERCAIITACLWKRKTKQEAEFAFYSTELIAVYSKDSGTERCAIINYGGGAEEHHYYIKA